MVQVFGVPHCIVGLLTPGAMKECTAFVFKVKTFLWNVRNDTPATQHSAADRIININAAETSYLSHSVCLFFVHFTDIFLLSMFSAHYNIQSQIKQGVTVTMLFRSESVASSTMCLQRKKCLFTGVTKTGKCKIKLWNLYVNILSFSLFHHRCSTANLNSK